MKNTIKPVALLFGMLLLIQFLSAEEKKPFKRRFSLKLSAGFMSAGSMGDVNNALESFNNNEVFYSLRKANSDRIKGQIETLNNRAFDWEAELRFDLTPRIGFGVAVAAPFHAHNESTLTYFDDNYRGTWTWFYKPEVKVFFPVKLSAYYSFSFISKLSISVGAGVGVYPSRIAQIIESVEIWPDGEYQDTWELKAKRNFALGYHGTAALEYSLSGRLAAVVEFQMKHIRISGFTGNEKGPDLWGGQFDVDGTLYYCLIRNSIIGASHTKLRVYEDLPPDDRYFAGLREAVLNLSGFSLRMGLRIRIF